MKQLAGLMLIIAPVPVAAAAPSAARWAHVGNTYNSAIFVDRAILSVTGSQRPFRMLRINTQHSAGWIKAEDRGIVDCRAHTLLYEGVVSTKVDGSRQSLRISVAKPMPFPARGVMRAVAQSMCSGKLGPTVVNPSVWTKNNFRPG